MKNQPQPRPYQREALAAIQRELAVHRSTLLELPTGTGKTVVFSLHAQSVAMSGGRTLVLVHRDELLGQAAQKCEAVGLHVEREQGKHRASLAARVVVASVQTLARQARLARWPRDHFAAVVIDEAHHAVAPGYRTVVDHFADAKVLGVTATPKRADGVGLSAVFASVAYRLELRQAITDGWLVPIRARRIVLDGIDLGQVRTRGGDLAQDELAAILSQERALRGVVEPLLEQAGHRKTVVFGVDVAHAQALAAELNRRRPGSARAVSGSTHEDERRALLAAFRRGEYQYLANCALLTEGWDEPSVECVAMARPTKSVGLYMQCVGRGTRLSPETGKRELLLLAFGAAAGKHRLVSPLDCLVGDLTDDLRAELDHLLGQAPRRLEEVLAQATGVVEERREHAVVDAKLRWHAEQIDVFFGEPQQRLDAGERPGWAEAMATPRQLAALERHGLDASKLPAGFSMADASRLLTRLAQRHRAGLCSLKAARLIGRSGIDTRNLTHERARELLEILRRCAWRPWALHGTPEYLDSQRSKDGQVTKNGPGVTAEPADPWGGGTGPRGVASASPGASQAQDGSGTAVKSSGVAP